MCVFVCWLCIVRITPCRHSIGIKLEDIGDLCNRIHTHRFRRRGTRTPEMRPNNVENTTYSNRGNDSQVVGKWRNQSGGLRHSLLVSLANTLAARIANRHRHTYVRNISHNGCRWFGDGISCRVHSNGTLCVESRTREPRMLCAVMVLRR